MSKALLKAVIPPVVRAEVRKWRQARQDRQDTSNLETVMHHWTAVRDLVKPRTKPGTMAHVLVVPSDPHLLVGSYGDDAMISAVRHMAQQANPAATIHAIVSGPDAAAIAVQHGLIPHDIWAAENYASAVAGVLEQGNFDAVVAIGADVIDGVYEVDAPSKIVVALDIAVRMGVPATILGASFSKRPDPRLKPFFDQLHADVRVCIRDALSLERLGAFTTKSGELVADTAFMLQPDVPDAGTMAWIEARRAEGKLVCGFNIHPMLLHDQRAKAQELLIEPAIKALMAVAGRRKIAWLVIAHDNREAVGDLVVLRPLFEQLAPQLGEDVYFFPGTRAAHAKAIVGKLDGVITGRMHLSIASLGRGTPVAGIVYQDKFEGLMSLFEIDNKHLMTVEQFSQSDVLAARIEAFFDALPALKQQVENRRPAVLDLSRSNFSTFAVDPVLAA